MGGIIISTNNKALTEDKEMTTFNCMRPNKEKLAENKRKHQEWLRALIGKSVVGHNLIIDEVTAVDIENDTVTGFDTVSGMEVTVPWKEITFAER